MKRVANEPGRGESEATAWWPRACGLARLVAFAAVFVLLGCTDPGAGSVDVAAEPPADAISEPLADATFDLAADKPTTEDVVDEGWAVEDLPPDDAPPLSKDEDVSCGLIYVTDEPSDEELDGGVRCTPGRVEPCRCETGGAGARTCGSHGLLGVCWCLDHPVVTPGTDPDAGIVVYPDASTVLPPRLVRPISGVRVMSQRPTLRWVLPAGLTRARVELCDDRACTRSRMQVEVTGTSWRSPTPLRPGVVFWRVRGLGTGGEVAWTSATWEFAVRHRDTPVDTIGGPLKDFDGDGYDDALLADTQTVVLLRGGPGGGRRRPEPILQSGLREAPEPDRSARGGYLGMTMEVGDINGDGLADVALSHDEPAIRDRETEFHIALFLGGTGCPLRPAGVLRPPAHGLDWSERSVGEGLAVGDFNGDGFGDVIAADDRALRLYSGGPMGVTAVPRSHIRVLGSEWFGFMESTRMLGDVDGDGYADVGVGNYGMSGGRGQVQVFYGNPDGRLEARVQTIPAPEWRGARFGREIMGGDFDGDGYSDLIVASDVTISWYRGSSSGLEFAQFGYGASLGTPGDLDGDGYVELVEATRGTIWRSRTAAEFALGPYISINWLLPNAVGRGITFSPGDMDSDGYDDVITNQRVLGVGVWVFLFRGRTLTSAQPAFIWQLRDFGTANYGE